MRWTSHVVRPSARKLPRPCLVLLLVLVSCSVTGADEWITPTASAQLEAAQADDRKLRAVTVPFEVVPTPTDVFSSRAWITDDVVDQPKPLVVGSAGGERELTQVAPSHGYADSSARFGWWAVGRQGALTKVGEYQDLKPSPFWDFDLLKSDGARTLDLFGTGLDNETTQAGLYYFTPALTTDVRYQRFLHRLDHDPLSNMPSSGSGAEIVKEDLNVGEDYAVRVQDMRAAFSGNVTKNVKYRLGVHVLRKKGERQSLGTHHGAPGGGFFCSSCHVLSQRQEIDWTTTRLEPAVEARFGSLIAEYSRPMRMFSQNDALVTRSDGWAHPYGNYAVDYPYAVVPENVSQTDRLKLRGDLPFESEVYSQLYHGDTHNQNRDTRRRYYGLDVRLSNAYFDRVHLNGFVRHNRQLNQLPPFLVPPEDITLFVPTAIIPPYGLRHPIDYLRTSTGANITLRPFRETVLANRLAVNLGAELGVLERTYADFQVQNPAGFANQGRTPFTIYSAAASMRWHPRFDTRLRYEQRNTSSPLYGVNDYAGFTNSNLPTREDVVGLDASWLAADNLMATANISAENRQNRTNAANFTEDDYPMTFAIWYAPAPAWSISGGYGYYTNWIDQDMYFPSDTPNIDALDRQAWNYGGRSQVLSFGGSYAWTERWTLSGSVQFVWALNTFDPLESWPDLPEYSRVLVNTRRYTSGIDWSANRWATAYLRYMFEDYDDGSAPYNSGSAHMVLAGLSATR